MVVKLNCILSAPGLERLHSGLAKRIASLNARATVE